MSQTAEKNKAHTMVPANVEFQLTIQRVFRPSYEPTKTDRRNLGATGRSEPQDWRKLEDFDSISTKIAPDQERRSIRDLKLKKTFSANDLGKINRECGPLERLLLLLGLNCSFGAAESGRLIPDELFIGERNPLEHAWANYGYSSSEDDSWIAYLRPKSGGRQSPA